MRKLSALRSCLLTEDPAKNNNPGEGVWMQDAGDGSIFPLFPVLGFFSLRVLVTDRMKVEE